MLPPNMLDVHGFAGRDGSSRGLLSETMCAELRPDVTATSSTKCHLLEARAVARCHEEFDETIRTASEPECSKRRVESTTGGSTRSMDGRSPRQGFSKGSASLQSLVRRRSRRHVGGGSSLPLEAELSSRQAVYPADLVKDSLVNTAALVFRNADDDTRTATPTSTLIYATSSSAQPSTSRPDSNNVQDVSSSASNVVTSNGSNATSTTTTSGSAAGRQFGNAAAVSLPRSAATGVATPGPSTSSWNNSVVEQESDYVVDPVQGNAYHKGHFLGKVGCNLPVSLYVCVRACVRACGREEGECARARVWANFTCVSALFHLALTRAARRPRGMRLASSWESAPRSLRFVRPSRRPSPPSVYRSVARARARAHTHTHTHTHAHARASALATTRGVYDAL
ncbi:hypothetical protein EAI_14166 [Harpegnathos saltator]|uniref:Uncharacterized protein n=1 Tax=Harpegnathos saltator TaxID=610380 RepID=E2BUT3_HARSA|nr:hypothetical protein EAI_14166 [Harpegnathos saltator]